MTDNGRIHFKCRACNEYAEPNRTVREGFVDWAYRCAEWSDFDENVPPLDQDIFLRKKTLPKTGEIYSIKVTKPFDKMIGNNVNINFVPAIAYLDGFEYSPDDINISAIVRCRIEKVITKDEFSAWIRVVVTDVTLYSELYKKYRPSSTDKTLETFSYYRGCDWTELDTNRWKVASWTGQGDIGEENIIYIDDNNVRHLVAMGYYDFHQEIMYLGNVVESNPPILKK